MPLPFTPSCRVVAVLACALLAVSAKAQLIKVSPFLPPQGAANAPTQNAPLTYAGSMEDNGVQQYRIVDPQRKIGTWLKVGERDANLDVALKSHDADHETVTIDHGGQTLTLELKTPKVISSGMMPRVATPMPTAPVNMSPAVLQTVVPKPTPADEQRRLEAVAAEVARRRALREQAAQQAQGLPPTQPQAVPTRGDYQQQQQQQAPRGGRPGLRTR